MYNWPNEIGIDRFSLHMFKLQDQAGLTFREAMAVLTHPGYTDELADKWGSTANNVRNLRRKGFEKVHASGISPDELAPTYFFHAF
ncbi:MAG: hypothetical protein LBJ20_03705 [Candidatus Methanoplasma sp.]|jgi:hypothetical protein|nr:hypothetical protein [Candidatus Methanoplasma sp.]